MIVTGKHSEKNIKTYADELSYITNGDETKFMNIWNEAKKGKYDFLTLDLRDMKAYRNLDTLLYSLDEDNNNETNKQEKE